MVRPHRRPTRSPPASAELRQAHLDEQREAIGSAVDDYFLYDEVLETALMLGIAPAEAWRSRPMPSSVLTALARGTPEREAWEMTKWFDTNYHYVVPEIDAPSRRFARCRGASRSATPTPSGRSSGRTASSKLSKLADGLDPAELARSVGAALWTWVREQQPSGFRLQLDEPCLGMG